MLIDRHPGVQLYKQAYTLTRHMPPENQCRIALRFIETTNRSVYANPLPGINEIAVILPGDGDTPTDSQDIILFQKWWFLSKNSRLSSSLSLIALCASFSNWAVWMALSYFLCCVRRWEGTTKQEICLLGTILLLSSSYLPLTFGFQPSFSCWQTLLRVCLWILGYHRAEASCSA